MQTKLNNLIEKNRLYFPPSILLSVFYYLLDFFIILSIYNSFIKPNFPLFCTFFVCGYTCVDHLIFHKQALQFFFSKVSQYLIKILFVLYTKKFCTVVHQHESWWINFWIFFKYLPKGHQNATNTCIFFLLIFFLNYKLIWITETYLILFTDIKSLTTSSLRAYRLYNNT